MSELYKQGDVIGGKYEVHSTLGKGRFGVVYLVYNWETEAACALKTFKDGFLVDTGAREAFQKEALLWVNLQQHPFVLAAKWVQELSGRLFLEMDHVAPDAEGRVNLRDHLRCGRPLPPERAVEWAIQFCLGMEHANAHGVNCHRDIKPANMLISQGVLKITDFGLAAAAEVAWKGVAARQGGLLVTGGSVDGFGLSLVQSEGKMRCGTPGYLTPEVYRGEPADVRSDIYSFGLVLWQMTVGSGSPPFVGAYRGDIETYMRETYEQQMKGRVLSAGKPLSPIIERCVRPDASDRYQNFAALRDELTQIYWKHMGRTPQVPQVGKRSAGYWSNKGASLDVLGRHEEAIGCFDKALTIDLRNALVWNNRGAALGGLGRNEEALVCYNKALEIDPRDKKAWFNKGNALADLGRREEAIRCFDKALTIDPHDTKAWNNKGYALACLGRREEAIGCYNKALEIDPRDKKAWFNRGNALADLGRREEAIRCFDKALSIDPHDTKAWNNKGNALADLGQGAAAILCFDRTLSIDPRDANGWNNKGATLTDLGHHEEALVCYDKALSIDPRLSHARFGKAVAEDKAGKASAAVQSYGRFLALAPAQDANLIAYAQKRIQELKAR